MRWAQPTPGTLVDIDVHAPDVEVLPQAWVDEAGAPHARQVNVHASRHARLSIPAWVIAWARPTTATNPVCRLVVAEDFQLRRRTEASEWRWVLLLWRDKLIDPPGHQQWRHEWLEPDVALIKPTEGDVRARVPSAVSDALATL